MLSFDALAVVAGEKADHIATNWQDQNGFENWNYAARQVASVAAKLQGI